jgi:hypothetical protein
MRTFPQVRGLEWFDGVSFFVYCQVMPDKGRPEDEISVHLIRRVRAAIGEAVKHTPAQGAPILDELAAVSLVRRALDEVVLDMVRAARQLPSSRGRVERLTPGLTKPIDRAHTWHEIGLATGMTRQSAHELFAEVRQGPMRRGGSGPDGP